MDNMNQPKSVHKTNWMVIILLIVIVAIVALGIWWWTNDTAKIASLEQQVAQSEVKATVTPTPTASVSATDKYAGWKTYTDDYYGYEVKYPADWKVTDRTTEVFDPNSKELVAAPHQGIITVFEGPGNFDFSITTRKTDEPFDWGPYGIGFTRTELGNKVTFSGRGIQKYYQIFYGVEGHSSFHYGNPGEPEHGGPSFTVGDREYMLECELSHKPGATLLRTKMDQQTEDTVDKIVESFRLI